MQITNVKIRRIFEDAPIKVVASITFDDVFVVHDVKLIQRKDAKEGDYMLVMPCKKLQDGSFKDVCHPIVSTVRDYIQEELLKAYIEAKNNPSFHDVYVKDSYENSYLANNKEEAPSEENTIEA